MAGDKTLQRQVWSRRLLQGVWTSLIDFSSKERRFFPSGMMQLLAEPGLLCSVHTDWVTEHHNQARSSPPDLTASEPLSTTDKTSSVRFFLKQFGPQRCVYWLNHSQYSVSGFISHELSLPFGSAMTRMSDTDILVLLHCNIIQVHPFKKSLYCPRIWNGGI